MKAANNSDMAEELAGRIGVSDEDLHEIEYEDVSISREALEAVKCAVKKILSGYMTGDELKKLSVADAFSLFIGRLFWAERSGNLYLCSDLCRGGYCLPIPAGHWGINPNVMTQ